MSDANTHTYPVVNSPILGRAAKPLIDRVIHAAGVILSCYAKIQQEAEKLNPDDINRQHWHKNDLKQAYLDGLRSLEMAGLIDTGGYHLDDYRVSIGGTWYETVATKTYSE